METTPGLRLQATADALAEAFASVEGAVSVAYDPVGEVENGMIAVGASARGRGTDLEELAHQLDRDDQWEEWTVHLYHYLDDPATDWASARAMIGEMRAVIDIDYTLGNEVREARITDWVLEPNEPEEDRRRMLIGTVTVSVLYQMPVPE